MNRKLVAGYTLNKAELSTALGSDGGVDVFEGRLTDGLIYPNDQNIYLESKRLVAEIRKIFAELLNLELPSAAYPGFLSFLFSLQFRIAQEELPLLRAVSVRAPAYEVVELWDCLLPPSLGCPVTLENLQLRTTSKSTLTRTAADIAGLSKADCESPAHPGLPLLVIGSDVDVTLGTRYYCERYDLDECNVLLKSPNFRLMDELGRVQPELRIRDIYVVPELSAPDVLPRQLAEQFRQLETELRNQLEPAFSHLLKAIHRAGALEALVERAEPPLLFGTFEKSPLGVVLSHMPQRTGYDLVSYQHGIMNTTGTMNYFNFDEFLVWDQQFADLVKLDGYDGKLSVLDLRPEPSRSPRPEHRWPWQRPALVYFEQPLHKSPYSMTEYRSILTQLSELAKKLRMKLRIKPHPRTYDDQSYIDVVGGLPRVSRLDPTVTLENVFEQYDLGISMTSTALLDFIRSGKPGIAYDPKHWGTLTGMPDGLFTQTTDNTVELGRSLEQLVSG